MSDVYELESKMMELMCDEWNAIKSFYVLEMEQKQTDDFERHVIETIHTCPLAPLTVYCTLGTEEMYNIDSDTLRNSVRTLLAIMWSSFMSGINSVEV